jgi:hypothetical protein
MAKAMAECDVALWEYAQSLLVRRLRVLQGVFLKV